MARRSRKILVTGGATFLGDNIAAALLAEGTVVTLLHQPERGDMLGSLAQRLRCSSADLWNPASLRGKARGHSLVLHTVGSLQADPARGLSHDWLNNVSARNVANMCVGDGVSRMILLSSARAPWISNSYIRAKRAAERYLLRLGLQRVVIRAPLVYVPGQPRPAFFRILSALGIAPPLSWLLGRMAPMPIDDFARAVARIALAAEPLPLYNAPQLRRMLQEQPAPQVPAPSYEVPTEEEMRFGWSPQDDPS